MFCNVCNKLCSTVANLRMHMKTHQSWKFSSSAINVPLHGCGIVSSRCSSDNMPFFRRSLIFWKRLVPGYQLSPFCNPTTLSMWPMWKGEALLPLAKVTLCYKVFTTPDSLRNHTKIHTGATSCPVCSRQLATVSTLNRHMKSEHREALDAIWADRSIKVLFQNHIVSLVPSPPKTLWMNWRCVAFQATTGATTNIRLLGRAQLGSNISVQHVTTLREAPWNDKCCSNGFLPRGGGWKPCPNGLGQLFSKYKPLLGH